jgi:diguanylate cyclase (GGDEF)-like protein
VGVGVVGPGFRIGAVSTKHAVTESVKLSGPNGVLGRVVVPVELNGALARSLGDGAGLTDGDRIGFASEPAPLEPATIERGGVRYRAVAAPPLEILTPQARIDAAQSRTEMRLAFALLATLLLVAVVAWLEGRTIVRSIRRLVRAANAMANGDLERRVPVTGRDELAVLARSFNDMAEQLGARLQELEAERGRLHDAITLFGDALSATHDVDQLLRVVLDAMLEATGAMGGLVIVDGGIAAQAGTVAGDERIEVPLRAGRINYGRVVLSGTDFSDDDRMTAVSLAAHAVIALDNAHLHRIVEQQALVDGLTGLANRRAGERALEQELARAQRFGGNLALVLCDLDNFKAVNDRHGHLAGDDVLRELGEVLAETVRTVDVAARWGGEEFALVLPGTDAEGGVQLAERAREALEARTLLTPDGEPLQVTASFGVAAFPEHGEGLVAAADAALYRAKRSGKNRVETAETPPAVRGRS